MLDQLYKLRFVKFRFNKWYSMVVLYEMAKRVERAFVCMYACYCVHGGCSSRQGQDSSSASHNIEITLEQHPHAMVKSIYTVHLAKEDSMESKSKVDGFLFDGVEENSHTCCILNRLKMNSNKNIAFFQM